MPEMNTYHVTFTENDAPKETFDMLVYAVDQLAAEGWAADHAARHNLTLGTEMAQQVRDLDKWTKTHKSTEPVGFRERQREAKAAGVPFTESPRVTKA